MENTVILNLKSSTNAKAFTNENLIHKIEFEQVLRWIHDSIAELPPIVSMSDCKGYTRQHKTISVFGSRGSGKTSFLMSLLEHYRINENKYNIHILDVIDPTLIEEKGHVFLTIISLIKDSVEKKLGTKGCEPQSPCYHKRQNWKELLKRLAHGLPSIDGVGKQNEENWQDPEYIMNKGLRAVHSAKELERNFHEFIEMSLNILGKDAFILPLDDIDVNFRKGWPVLETIRKYLTTPRIITIISGDVELFQKAVRKQHWYNFGKGLLINEGQHQQKLEEYNDLVTEMEGQYLQKILRPDRRIHLNTLLEKIETYNMIIEVISENSKRRFSITQMYGRILRQFGIHNVTQAPAYYNFLLSLPLRTQIQFMLLTDSDTMLERIQLTDPFLSSLSEKQVNIELVKNNPRLFNIILLRLLLKEKIITESYQLQPNTSDQNLNSSLLALSLLFAQKVKNDPYMIFDYLIRIGYIRNLHDSLDYQENVMTQLQTINAPSTEGICKQAGLFQNRVLRDAASTIAAYIRGFMNYKSNGQDISTWGSTVPLKGLYSFSKKDRQGRIDGVFGYQLNPESCLAYIPLSLSEYSMRNTTIVTYSVFTLLAAIGDLIREKDSLIESLMNLSQIRSYVMPDFKRSLNIAGDAPGDEENYQERENIDEQRMDEFENQVKNWIDDYPECGITPYLLGKIVTRFFYALDNIEKKRTGNLGVKMHWQIRALLNAVLIEDIRENRKNQEGRTHYGRLIRDININNTVESDEIFMKNLFTAVRIDGNFSFSRWFLSCPLLLAYLPKDLVIDISKYTNGKEPNMPISIYHLLTQVELASKEDLQPIKEDLPSFYGRNNKIGAETINALMDIDGVTFEKFRSLDVNNRIERSQFINNCQGYFKNKITQDSIESLQKHIETALKSGDNKVFTRTVREWQNNSY